MAVYTVYVIIDKCMFCRHGYHFYLAFDSVVDIQVKSASKVDSSFYEIIYNS